MEPVLQGPPIDLDMIRWHADPFFAECRAYGRIKEVEARAKRSSKRIGAQCYGFIESSEHDRRLDSFVQSQGLDLDYPQSALKTRRDREANPLRAIVKEFVEGEAGVPRTKFGARTLLGKIKALNKIGVYNGDIPSANIKNGLLLDFGLARTEPHCIFHERLPPGEVDGMKHEDLVKFDEMIEEEGIRTKIVALPFRDFGYCQKLRPRANNMTSLAS